MISLHYTFIILIYILYNSTTISWYSNLDEIELYEHYRLVKKNSDT